MNAQNYIKLDFQSGIIICAATTRVAQAMTRLSRIIRFSYALVLTLCLFLCFVAPSYAHDTLFSVEAVEDSPILKSFGSNVIVLSDINSDGQRDVAISQHLANGSGNTQFGGKVHFYSGLTSSLLVSLSGSSVADFYGLFVGNLGDLNGDGYDEFSIYFDEDDASQDVGELELYGTKNFNFIGAKTGFLESDYFGRYAIGIEDLNGNGYRDYIIFGGDTATDKGRVVAYDGNTNGIIYAIQGTQDAGEFGLNMAELGDIDNDGVSDFLVFAPFEAPVDTVSGLPNATYHSAGRIHAISGKTSEVIYLIAPEIAQAKLGNEYSVIQDLNEDGINDFVAGCASCSSSVFPHGYLNVYSGANGSLLAQMLPESSDEVFCSNPVNLGDISGDGRGDFACLAGTTSKLEIRIIRGGTYKAISIITSAEGELFTNLNSADFNSDGQLDLIISSNTGVFNRLVKIIDLDIPTPQSYTLRASVPKSGELRIKTILEDDFELCDLELFAASSQQKLDSNEGKLVYQGRIESETNLSFKARNLPGLSSRGKSLLFRSTINCGDITVISKDKRLSFAKNRRRPKVSKGTLIRKIQRKLQKA